MDQIKIGKFIAERRKNKNLTQMQLAEKLGITDRAVSKWENGKAMPDSAIMLELCDTLEISVNDLLHGEVISMENYKAFCDKVVNDSELINAYKELYNGVYLKVRDLIPNYLEKQTSFIIDAVTLNRSLIISRAFDEGIIEDDNTRKKFIYNGVIFK